MKSVLLTASSLSLFSLVVIVSSVNAQSIDMGKLPWKGGVSAKVSQTWHSDLWKTQALDIKLPAGTEVRAPIASKVVRFCTTGKDKNHAAIILETTESRERFSLIHVKIDTKNFKRDKIFSQGDLIGHVAADIPQDKDCAWSTGIHLHFGLPSKDVKIDGLTFSSTSPKLNSPLTSNNSR